MAALAAGPYLLSGGLPQSYFGDRTMGLGYLRNQRGARLITGSIESLFQLRLLRRPLKAEEASASQVVPDKAAYRAIASPNKGCRVQR